MLASVQAGFMLERERKREGERVRKSLECVRMRAYFMLARVHTPSSPVRERERDPELLF
jgi:hypothetical protein